MIKLSFYSLLIAFSCLLSQCSPSDKPSLQSFNSALNTNEIDTALIKNKIEVSVKSCKWNTYLRSKNLVNIQEIDPSLKVELKYSSEDNFMKKDMYGCLDSCFLQPDVAHKLAKAQQLLKQDAPNLSLLIYDGVRPRSVQQYMWDILDLPINEKVKFVSNPKNGSLHNFGAAVDLTIIDLTTSTPLDMGTPYDYIGIKAWPIKEKVLLKKGVLNGEQIANRKLLRKVMTKAGFFNIQTEWWHFNSCYRKKAYQLYTIIEGLNSEPI